MLKRLLCILLCLLISVCFTSCSVLTDAFSDLLNRYVHTIDEATNSDAEPEIVPQYTAQPYEFPVLEGDFNSVKRSDYFGYNHLNDSQKIAYDAIYYAAQRMDKAVFLVGKCTEYDVAVVMQALLYDCPQLVWVPSTYNISHFHDGSLGVSFYNPEQNINYLYSSEEARNGVLDALYNEINSFIDSNIEPSMSQLEIEIAVHDWICSIMEYDEVAADAVETNTESKYFSAWNVIGAILNKKAVCAGYAKSFQLILNYLGINCVGIRAMSEDEMHMLCAAEIDGDWYYVDPTWDDQSFDVYDCSHSYFNLSYSQISETHDIFKDWQTVVSSNTLSDANFNIFLPECTREDYNYFTYKNTQITDEHQFKSVVISAFGADANIRRKCLEFQITYGQVDTNTIDSLLKKQSLVNNLEPYFRHISAIKYAVLDNGVFFIKVDGERRYLNERF